MTPPGQEPRTAVPAFLLRWRHTQVSVHVIAVLVVSERKQQKTVQGAGLHVSEHTHVHTLMHTVTHLCTLRHSHTHSYTHTAILTHTLTLTHRCTHTRPHTCTYTHTYMHTHTPFWKLSGLSLPCAQVSVRWWNLCTLYCPVVGKLLF